MIKIQYLRLLGINILALQYLAFCISSAGFQASAPTCCDGWWMVVVDGGWWWMVDGGGWVEKKFFNFSQNLHIDSTPKVNFLVFGLSEKTFLWV